jgi:hypothetical protein
MIANHSAGNAFPWPDEAIAELRRLHERGETSSQIAAALSTQFHWPLSRNAIIGKRMRMGMTRSEEFKSQAQRAQNRRQAEKKAQERLRLQAIAERTAARLAMQRAADEERQNKAPKPKEDNVIVLTRVHPDTYAVAPKTMMDPCFCGCKWPLERTAENGDTLFCTNETPDRLDTYCPDHKRRAYQRSRTPAQIKADQAIREVRIANARAMGLRQAFDFRAKRAAR